MIEFNVKQHEVKKKNQFEIQQRESSRAKNNLKPGVKSFFFLVWFSIIVHLVKVVVVIIVIANGWGEKISSTLLKMALSPLE